MHTAASTRWTMSRTEAEAVTVDPLRAVLSPADRDTHVVHVSTAYVGGVRAQEDLRGPEFEGDGRTYRGPAAIGYRLERTGSRYTHTHHTRRSRDRYTVVQHLEGDFPDATGRSRTHRSASCRRRPSRMTFISGRAIDSHSSRSTRPR